MPTTATAPTVFPENLWDMPTWDGSTGRQWYCCQAKPNQEKSAARAFAFDSLPHFLPLTLSESRRPSSGQVTRSLVPLFTGYLFLWGDSIEVYKAKRTLRLTHLIDVHDQQKLDADLRCVARLIASEAALLSLPQVPEGQRFRVVAGPLAGCEGHVERRKGRRRFVASIRFLGRSVSADLEDWQVERA